MDTVTSAALEEICAQGSAGLPLSSLWPKLGPVLSSCGLGLSQLAKSSVWANILKIPALEFRALDAALASTDPMIQRVENAELMKLKVVARESLRDNFVGLYDAQSAAANISPHQCRALERLAAARENGVMQSQLGKEFDMEGKYIFYVLKHLESRGLITRQSAVLKTKDAFGDGDPRHGPSVSTNIVYLYRFAKQLGSQQKFEITKDEPAGSSVNASEAGATGECLTEDLTKEDVIVKDYLPAMKAVCDKLESAKGMVLVVSDIKHDLGYKGDSTSHRAWRTICSRLKEAGIVEEFDAKVNEKVCRCLRMVKKFPGETNEPSLFSSGNHDKNEVVAQFGRKHQIIEQVLELPLEHQVFDIIVAGGLVGLTLKEVCERLGLDKKRNHSRILNIVSRFGLHLAAESHGKVVAYRARAPEVYYSNATEALPYKSDSADHDNRAFNAEYSGSLAPNLLDCMSSVPDKTQISAKKIDEREVDVALHSAIREDGAADEALSGHGNLQDVLPEPVDSSVGLELALVVSADENALIPSEIADSSSQKSSNTGSSQRYLRLPKTADATQREQRILGRVQEEKFILRAELYKWLVSLEKDKGTTMDRKTIDRTVNELQREGQCKCTAIHVPSVTNCNRSRKTQVIHLPSVDIESPTVYSEIHDRLRSFEMQSRGHGSSKLKNSKSVAVLEDVQRIQNTVGPDTVKMNSKHEALRGNGFVSPKMIRAKLLHRSLWKYIHSLPNNNLELLSTASNPHSSYSLFSLDEAIKAIPVEKFLQVAGSTQNFDDMMEMCNSRLRLADLPVDKFRILMDNLATGRLSKVIDILRRLKLIRLVNNGHREEGFKVQQAILTHAMELKPYIEEPLTILAKSFNFIPLDLRPRVRHDFILSSEEAVDEYWQTREYCYSAADPKAAIHAFPGSAVHEVYLFRSWASARIMTAEKRAELLNRVMRDCTNERVSFKECEKIAKDLNLTLEQVLRVYNDKRQKRFARFQGAVPEEGHHRQASERQASSVTRKRRRSSKMPLADSNVDSENEQLSQVDIAGLFGSVANRFGEEQAEAAASLEEHDDVSQTLPDEICTEEPRHSTENEGCSNKKMETTRQRRSSWTDEADRKLVIHYVRHRVERGGNSQRADWASLSDLPGPPSACAKRMSSLKRNKYFRKALNQLLDVVNDRYKKHRLKLHSKINDGSRLLARNSVNGDVSTSSPADVAEEEEWDDFNCRSVKQVLEDVLRCKKITYVEAFSEFQSGSMENSNVNINSGKYVSHVQKSVSSGTPFEDNEQDEGTGQHQSSLCSSKRRRLQKKFTWLFNKESPVHMHIYESLAVSNAVELFKLIFLNTSTASMVSSTLADTLRHYSEQDLYAAFSYLREKKILAGGPGNQQYELSQNFIQNISRSVFPANTGRRVSRFSKWLHEREKDLNAEEIVLVDDLQCGDVVHLFSLVHSGEISIFPCLPAEGIGEAEDMRNLKRGRAVDESPDNSKSKKSKFVADGETFARREKGFPGLKVCAHREAFHRAKVLELSMIDVRIDSELDADVVNRESGSTPRDNVAETFTSPSPSNLTTNAADSPWDAMESYAEKVVLMPSVPDHWTLPHSEVFQAVYGAVKRAGDQGLSMEEVSQIANEAGEKGLLLLVDVLQSFGRVARVNAFDAVRVVDAVYRPKYFLTLLSVPFEDEMPQSSTDIREMESEGNSIHQPKNHDHSLDVSMKKANTDTDQMHKVTVLNLPEETDGISSEVHDACVSRSSGGDTNLETAKFSSEFCVPIVPWVNGDGAINKVVYRGLVRRVLGIVMLNPGVLEEDIVKLLDVLNPQNCRKLLELMILEKHLKVRRMRQSTGKAPPSMLQSLVGTCSGGGSKSIFRDHFFANPKSGHLL